MPTIINKWYCGIIILALIGGSSLGPKDYFLGVMLTLVIYFVYTAGISSASQNPSIRNFHSLSKKSDEKKQRTKYLYFLSLVSMIGSYYLTAFYTGNSISDLISNISLAQSNYLYYQQFTEDNNLTSFTIEQIPAFAFSIFSKIWAVYVYAVIVANVRRIGLHEILILSLSSLSLIYQSFGRGTSIEIFELIILIWCSMSTREIRRQFDIKSIEVFYVKKEVIQKKVADKKHILALVFVIGLLVFNFNISARDGFSGQIGCITHEICFDPDSLIKYISEKSAVITYQLEGYFTFGIFFLSNFVEESISPAGRLNLLNYILPLNFVLSPSIKGGVCNVVIDCGYAWIPDAVMFIETLGIPIFLVFVFFSGKVVAQTLNDICAGSIFLKFGMIYYLTLMLLSIPVGNFIFASYPNVASALIILGLFILHRIRF